MIGNWVASLKAMGRMFARVNSKCPTAFVPALSSNCAQAFSDTPARMQKREMGFIGDERSVGPDMGLLLRFFHDHAPHIAGDDLHRHFPGRQFVEALRWHQGERITVAVPPFDPFVDGRHPFSGSTDTPNVSSSGCATMI